MEQSNSKPYPTVIDNHSEECVDCKPPVVEIDNNFISQTSEVIIEGDLAVVKTIEELRNLEDKYVQALESGVLKGVQVLGYYEEGDTPAPITYYKSDTTSADDGGSVIDVGSIKVEHNFVNKSIDVRYYGVFPNQAKAVNSIQLTQLSTVANSIINFESNSSINVEDDTTLTLSNITVNGNNSVLIKTGVSISPMMSLSSNTDVTKLTLNATGVTSTTEGSVIDIVDGENINFSNNKILSSIKGIQIKPTGTGSVRNIRILNNDILNCRWGIFVGRDTETTTGSESIQDLTVIGNNIISGKTYSTGGDGIKLQKKVSNVIISSNVIRGYSRDGIDLFASGDKVIVTNNIISDNIIKGIDIKIDQGNYPVDVWGHNGRFIDISHNLFENNLTAIGVAMDRATGDYNYSLSINDNKFINNSQNAINLDCKYFTIKNNHFFFNSKSTDDNYHVIALGDDLQNDYAEFGIVSDNIFVNNGRADGVNWAIRVGAYCRNLKIEDNIINNDVNLENPYQTRGIYVNDFTSKITVRANNLGDSVTIPYRFPTDNSVISTFDEAPKYTPVLEGNINLTNKFKYEIVELLPNVVANRAVVNTATSVTSTGIKVFKNSSPTFNLLVDFVGGVTLDGNSTRETIPPLDTLVMQAVDTLKYIRLSKNVKQATSTTYGTVKKANISADLAPAVSESFVQTEVQAILTELRDVKNKLKSAEIMSNI